MNSMMFLMSNFFTHKDFLPDATQIPGTLYTPLQMTVEVILLALILGGVVWTVKHQKYMKPILTAILIALLLLEFAIDAWDSLASAQRGFDLSVSLPLYPCSIFMFTLPFAIWGRGVWREMACGYICTLGLTGALINFIYPISRLMDYSCISFPAFHTFFYHGSMLFTALVLLLSGSHQLHRFSVWWVPFLASIPGLLFSVPANIVNYSAISSDYMYFTGQHPLSQSVFGNQASAHTVTAAMYAVYLFGPALFYVIPWGAIRVGNKMGRLKHRYSVFEKEVSR